MTVTTRPSGIPGDPPGGPSAEPSGEWSHGGGLLGAWTVYRCELAKLVGQVRTRLAAVLCFLGPFAFVVALGMQDATPNDTLYGRWLHTSGFAVPMVILTFGSQWVFPALTSVVAGDMFASEDHFGTWTTILTRSRSRSEIFAGKSLASMTYALVIVVLLGASSIVAGLLLVGHQPLINLSGVLLGPGDWTRLVLMSWAVILPPVLAFTAVGLLISVATRNGPAGIAGPVVIGLVTQLCSMANTPVLVQYLLPTTAFKAWHGFLAARPFHGPLVWDLLVSATYTIVCLGIAYALLRRRDMRGS
jgi:ABC-2 type transport system permease protein